MDKLIWICDYTNGKMLDIIYKSYFHISIKINLIGKQSNHWIYYLQICFFHYHIRR